MGAMAERRATNDFDQPAESPSLPDGVSDALPSAAVRPLMSLPSSPSSRISESSNGAWAL